MNIYRKNKMQISSIDKKSTEPLFSQSKKLLKKYIYKNKLKPGDKIPNEEDLCSLFKVSRITIRRAILELINEGYLYRNHPMGTFIAESKLKLKFVGEIQSFAQEIVHKGYEVKDKILVYKELGANNYISEKLHITVGSKIYNFLRLRSVEKNVICLVDSYINSIFCPNLDMKKYKNDSLYRVLKKEYGLLIFKAYRTLEAVSADEKDAKILGINKGDPIFLVSSTSFLKNGSVLEYYEAKIRSDRSILALEIERIGIVDTA